MRLIACHDCHRQIDVTQVSAKEIACPCGTKLSNHQQEAKDVVISRCGSCGATVSSDASSCDFCGSQIQRENLSLNLICPECYARNDDSSKFCTGCGVEFAPVQIGSETRADLECPVCSCLMSAQMIAQTPVNECPKCNGIWVPEDALETLVKRAIDARQENEAFAFGLSPKPPRVTGGNPVTQAVVYRKCPACDNLMIRRNFQRKSGVLIDRCMAHGTWLDADELEQIAGFILNGGVRKAESPSSGQHEATPARHKERPVDSRFHNYEEPTLLKLFTDVFKEIVG
jgi:Zn-finger nucleic acid-binding protein